MRNQAHKQPSVPPQTLEEKIRADQQEQARAVWWLEYQINKQNFQKTEKK